MITPYIHTLHYTVYIVSLCQYKIQFQFYTFGGPDFENI